MLFNDEMYNSQYDIGDSSIISGGYRKLAEHISELLTRITESSSDVIMLKHKDNEGNEISINKKSISEKVYLRTEDRIIDLLKRTDKSSIKGYLSSWGVDEPDESNQDYSNYLRLLYLFYMLDYVVFPSENIFILLGPDHLSTDFSPIHNAHSGKYISFIMGNLLDDNDTRLLFEDEDARISDIVVSISKELDAKVDIDYPSVLMNAINDKTPPILTGMIDISDEIKRNFCLEVSSKRGVVYDTLDYLYRYTNQAYVSEMTSNIINIKEKLYPVDFERRLDDNLAKKIVPEESMILFLHNKDVERFYMQDHTTKAKNIDEFIENIIEFDKSLYRLFGEGIWLEQIGENYGIRGLHLAIIAKTYMDLGTSLYKMEYKVSAKKWEHLRSFRKTLSYKAPDIAMKIFSLEYEYKRVRYLETPLAIPICFKHICLDKNLYIQKIMCEVYTNVEPEFRINYLSKILDYLVAQGNQ